MSQTIPNRALVQIMKPSDDFDYWPINQQNVGWDDEMDYYVGEIHIVKRYNDYDESYVLDGISFYRWHKDWLNVLSTVGDRVEPYDNQRRTSCFWCGGLLKTTKEKYDKGILTFKYCPKCGR